MRAKHAIGALGIGRESGARGPIGAPHRRDPHAAKLAEDAWRSHPALAVVVGVVSAGRGHRCRRLRRLNRKTASRQKSDTHDREQRVFHLHVVRTACA